MNLQSAWKLVVLALSLTCCTVAWLACALSGGDLLACVFRGVGCFFLVWAALSVLGAALGAVVSSDGS